MPALGASTTLPSGARARLRYPHRSDAAGVRGLLARLGLEADDLHLTRALRPDPRDRVVVVAAVLLDRLEEVVALGALDRGARAPDLLLADEALAPGVGAVVAEALAGHGERARRTA